MNPIFLSDLGDSSPALVEAALWIQHVLLGSIGTTVATLAFATIGLLAMIGYLDLRRAGAAIIGCFIMFGAPTVATGIVAASSATDRQISPPSSPGLPEQQPATGLPMADPLAGAVVPPPL